MTEKTRYILSITPLMTRRVSIIVGYLNLTTMVAVIRFRIIGDTLFAKAFLIRVLGCLIFMCHRDLDLDLDLDLVL